MCAVGWSGKVLQGRAQAGISLRWRDDELILASIRFSSTFQLWPQLIYQTFDFISCYPQPLSSIFIKHAIQPTDAIIQLHYCLAAIEITIVAWCRWLSHPFRKSPQTLSSSLCQIIPSHIPYQMAPKVFSSNIVVLSYWWSYIFQRFLYPLCLCRLHWLWQL